MHIPPHKLPTKRTNTSRDKYNSQPPSCEDNSANEKSHSSTPVKPCDSVSNKKGKAPVSNCPLIKCVTNNVQPTTSTNGQRLNVYKTIPPAVPNYKGLAISKRAQQALDLSSEESVVNSPGTSSVIDTPSKNQNLPTKVSSIPVPRKTPYTNKPQAKVYGSPQNTKEFNKAPRTNKFIKSPDLNIKRKIENTPPVIPKLHSNNPANKNSDNKDHLLNIPAIVAGADTTCKVPGTSTYKGFNSSYKPFTNLLEINDSIRTQDQRVLDKFPTSILDRSSLNKPIPHTNMTKVPSINLLDNVSDDRKMEPSHVEIPYISNDSFLNINLQGNTQDVDIANKMFFLNRGNKSTDLNDHKKQLDGTPIIEMTYKKPPIQHTDLLAKRPTKTRFLEPLPPLIKTPSSSVAQRSRNRFAPKKELISVPKCELQQRSPKKAPPSILQRYQTLKIFRRMKYCISVLPTLYEDCPC